MSDCSFTAQSKQKTTADVFPIASNFICANAAATTVNGSRDESVNRPTEARNHHAWVSKTTLELWKIQLELGHHKQVYQNPFSRRECRSVAPRPLTLTALLKVCDALSQKLNWFVTFPSFLPPLGAALSFLVCTVSSLSSPPSAGVAWCGKCLSSVHALHF